jgi:hypothetical protein
MMLYYMLPLVRQYLPVDHFHHFAVLVTSITMLLSDPTCTDVDIVNVLLHYFVKKNRTSIWDHRNDYENSQPLSFFGKTSQRPWPIMKQVYVSV